MKWAILIPTLISRRALFKDLSERLRLLCQKHNDDVVCLMQEDAEPSADVAERRNRLLACADEAFKPQYVSFIDDDDLVTADYVESILPLLDGVHTVQFHQAFYSDGVFQFVEERGLSHHGIFSDGMGRHFRDISHLSATRRELVLPFRHDPNDSLERHSEDMRWVDDMRLAGRLKTEHVVNRVLYHYLWRSQKEEFCLTS